MKIFAAEMFLLILKRIIDFADLTTRLKHLLKAVTYVT